MEIAVGAYNIYHKKILLYLKNKKRECWHNLFHQDSIFIRELIGEPPYPVEKIKEVSILAQTAFRKLENDGLIYDTNGDRWYSLTPEGEKLLANDLKKSSGGSKTIKKTNRFQNVQEIIVSPWPYIQEDFDITKYEFGRKINFIKESFKRNIIIRDIEQAYTLWQIGFNKPAVILAGSVIEELLRLYLEYKKIYPREDTFSEYIKACENNGLLKSAVHNLSNALRHFRNFVHIKKEEIKKHSISKATATAAVAAIFTIANDFD